MRVVMRSDCWPMWPGNAGAHRHQSLSGTLSLLVFAIPAMLLVQAGGDNRQPARLRWLALPGVWRELRGIRDSSGVGPCAGRW